MSSYSIMSNDDWKKMHFPQELAEVDFQHARPIVVSAFNLCREAERYLTQTTTATVAGDVEQDRRLMNVRIVGHLLNLSPSDAAAVLIARSVVSVYDAGTEDIANARTEGIAALGDFFDKHLLRSLRKFEGLTPESSEPPSRPSFNLSIEQLKEMLAEDTLDHQKAKDVALARDGYCCMLTGWMDEDYWDDVQSKIDPYAEISLTYTELVHIFPESTNTNFGDENELSYAANACMITESFGLGSVLKELKGVKVHRLENVLTLTHNAHMWFNKLKLWFEAVPNKPNCYEIRSFSPIRSFKLHDPPEVTLTSHVANPCLPLPDPRFLHIHALCCKVAHLSGASSLYNQLEGDNESQLHADPPSFIPALQAHLELMHESRLE